MKTRERTGKPPLLWRTLIGAIITYITLLCGIIAVPAPLARANTAAEPTPTRTEPLKLAPESDSSKFDTEGWKWDATIENDPNGKWTNWRVLDGTLTLKDFHLKTDGATEPVGWPGAISLPGGYISAEGPSKGLLFNTVRITIVLEGDNSVEAGPKAISMIEGGPNTNTSMTIRQADGTSGSLRISNSSTASVAFNGLTSLTVESGTVESDVLLTKANNDPFTDNTPDITLNGGKVTVRRADGKLQDGLYAKTMTVNGGELDITAAQRGISDCRSGGLSGSLTINGGTVTITNGMDDATNQQTLFNKIGIDTGTVTITNGKLTINAAYEGIDASKGITIGGGDISISADKALVASNSSNDAPISITGGSANLTATQNQRNGFAGGIWAGNVSITGGDQTITMPDTDNGAGISAIKSVTIDTPGTLTAKTTVDNPTKSRGFNLSGNTKVTVRDHGTLRFDVAQQMWAYGGVNEANLDVDPADTTALKAVIDVANGKDEADYTAASWEPFAKALDTATKVLAAQPNCLEQGKVDDAAKALEEATGKLEEKPAVSECVATLRFRDVSSETPHHEDIDWLACRGVSTGWQVGDGAYEFRPMNTVIRADMAAFLYRLAGEPAFDPASVDNPFADLKPTDSHYKEIMWLYREGITDGFRDEATGVRTFGGGRAVVRQDMAAFLHKLALKQGKDASGQGGVTFTDVDDKTPHAADIRWLARTGVTIGWASPDGKTAEFRGMNEVVRQDMAAFLHKMDTNVLHPAE